MRERTGKKARTPPVGEAAFRAHFARLSGSIVVGEQGPRARQIAEAISRARRWSESGDFLSALHAIGSVEVLMGPPFQGSRALQAGEVEEALGELRRAIERVGELEGRAEAALIWQAAREEVVRGSWEAAMALMKEGWAWLGRAP